VTSVITAASGPSRHLKSPRLPLYPRFIREAVLIEVADGVLVDGIGDLQMFKGRATGGLLKRLAKSLDGSRTVLEIEALLSPPAVPEDIRSLIAFLVDCGLVEDESTQGVAMRGAPAETLEFVRRAGACVNQDSRDICEKLRTFEIGIVLPGPGVTAGELLRTLLVSSGVGKVKMLRRDLLDVWKNTLDSPLASTLLLSVTSGAEDSRSEFELDAWCFDHHVRWLRACLDSEAGFADVGPVFDAERGTPCYYCVSGVNSNLSSSAKPTPMPSVPRSHELFWLSAVTAEVVSFVAHLRPFITGKAFKRYSIHNWTAQELHCCHLLDCPRCGLGIFPSERHTRNVNTEAQLDPALAFEELVTPEAISGTVIGRRGQRIIPDYSTLQIPKQLPNCRQRALDRDVITPNISTLDALQANLLTPRDPMDLRELATMLTMTAGIRHPGTRRGRHLKRWAPSAGNLGSVELYVVVRNVDGLPSGFYFYDPLNHALSRLQWRGNDVSPDGFIRRSISVSTAPDVLFVFTGALHRVMGKYGSFGYRLINLDAGAAMGQAMLVAESMGISARVQPKWADDVIEDQLNLRPFSEPVTGVVALSAEGSAALSRRGSETPLVQQYFPAMVPSRLWSQLPLPIMARWLYEKSKWRESDLDCESCSPPSGLLVQPLYQPTCIPLPRPDSGGPSLANVIARRSSVRRYSSEPISIEQVSTMLYCADHRDHRDWMVDSADQELEFMLLSSRICGLEPGLYKYMCLAHRLFSIGPAPSNIESLFVQPEFASAAATFWVTANLAIACACEGVRGYRRLLLRAGAAGQQLMTAALGTGLSGCLVAGVVPASARTLLGVDRYMRVPLFAVAVGRPS
jgi:SagB-type dehydrogenase family enzyme